MRRKKGEKEKGIFVESAGRCCSASGMLWRQSDALARVWWWAGPIKLGQTGQYNTTAKALYVWRRRGKYCKLVYRPIGGPATRGFVLEFMCKRMQFETTSSI